MRIKKLIFLIGIMTIFMVIGACSSDKETNKPSAEEGVAQEGMPIVEDKITLDFMGGWILFLEKTGMISLS